MTLRPLAQPWEVSEPQTTALQAVRPTVRNTKHVIVVQIMAPTMKPVKRRATGKIVTPSPWLNVNDHHMHPIARNALAQQWRTAGRLAWEQHPDHGTPMEHAHITVFVHRPRNTRADAGNFYLTAKPCIDGMVDAGLLPDDNDNYVTGPDMRRGTYGEPSITVVIEPCKVPQKTY